METVILLQHPVYLVDRVEKEGEERSERQHDEHHVHSVVSSRPVCAVARCIT